jgi:LysM repeat protein
MKLLLILLAAALVPWSISAQTMARSPAAAPADSEQLATLTKKIDEQNAKIDMLSQQILKLEQQLANSRPGVMIGETTPAPTAASSSTTATAATSASPAVSGANGNSHVVARGETLTSIAKMHSTTIGELQKFNHIENPLKLQAGQTIMIPPSPTPGASASASGE